VDASASTTLYAGSFATGSRSPCHSHSPTGAARPFGLAGRAGTHLVYWCVIQSTVPYHSNPWTRLIHPQHLQRTWKFKCIMLCTSIVVHRSSLLAAGFYDTVWEISLAPPRSCSLIHLRKQETTIELPEYLYFQRYEWNICSTSILHATTSDPVW